VVLLLAAGDYHHHIALKHVRERRRAPLPRGHTGLHHVAFLYAYAPRSPGRSVARRASVIRSITRRTTATASRSPSTIRTGTASSSYYDRPRHAWFDADGRPMMRNERIEMHDLIGNAA
jgi:catechol 2,3-dioxygenase